MTEFANMTIGELAGWAVTAAAAVATVVQVSPIKIDPWTWLARIIGRAINGEVIDKVDGLEARFTAMENTQDERHAKSARTRVLRFGDELYHDVYHSKEHFENVLQDIREYETYCDAHPNFENDRMHATAQLIRDTYSMCLREHKFK